MSTEGHLGSFLMFADKLYRHRMGSSNSETVEELGRLRITESKSRKAGWVTRRVNDFRRVAEFE